MLKFIYLRKTWNFGEKPKPKITGNPSSFFKFNTEFAKKSAINLEISQYLTNCLENIIFTDLIHSLNNKLSIKNWKM